MENNAINRRIIEIMEFLDVSPTVFADEIGVQRSGLSHIVKGRNRPSLDMVQKIVTRYPDINLNWLVNGQGNISASTPNVINLRQKKQDEQSVARETRPPEHSLKNTLFDPSSDDSEVAKEPLKPSGAVVSESTPSSPRTAFTQQDFDLQQERTETRQSHSAAPPCPPRADDLRQKEKSDKKIAKILVFYTDNTFEEFFK